MKSLVAKNNSCTQLSQSESTGKKNVKHTISSLEKFGGVVSHVVNNENFSCVNILSDPFKSRPIFYNMV